MIDHRNLVKQFVQSFVDRIIVRGRTKTEVKDKLRARHTELARRHPHTPATGLSGTESD